MQHLYMGSFTSQLSRLRQFLVGAIFPCKGKAAHLVAKYHCANGLQSLTAAFPNRRLTFVPRLLPGRGRRDLVAPARPPGWVFRSISRLFTCLIRPLSAVEPACKINPDKKPKRLDERERKKFNQSNFKLCTARFFKLPRHGWTRTTT